MGAELEITAGAAESVRDEWRAHAVAGGNAFVTPEWFDAALAAYGEDAVPFVAVLRDESGSASAVLPLFREGTGKRAVLRFAGSAVGDVFEPAARDEASASELMRRLGAELERRRDWGALVLDNHPREARWADAVSAGRLAATPMSHRDEVLPFATIGDFDWDGYLASKSRNFRSQVGRKERRLERDHEVEYRLVADPADLPGALEAFARLHHARWDARGGSQALTERSRAFHDEFARSALDRGWLRLWLLLIDGEAVAAWYGWNLGGRYSYYLAGFDPEWGSSSVGLLLQVRTVRGAIEEDAHTYDLLLGGEEYKARFADGERTVATRTVTRRLSRARVQSSAETLARSAADRMSPQTRARLKARVGGLVGRAPSSVDR